MSYETQKYKGFEINIETDEDPTNPREDSNTAIIAYNHRRYELGDEQLDVDDASEIKKWLKEKKAIAWQPVYMYEHSGITIKTSPFSDRWDSGLVGVIYITRESWKEMQGDKRFTKKLASEIMEAEIKTFDQYLTGEVYGRTVDDINESVWGYYGDEGIKYAIEEAKSAIDSYIKARTQEHVNKRKAQIKHGVALDKRMSLDLHK